MPPTATVSFRHITTISWTPSTWSAASWTSSSRPGLRRIPILTALGTGNKLDPTLLQVTDISKTSGCPAARVMRRELRARDIRRLKVVYSPEEPAETQQLEAPPPGRRSVPASVAWVPATAGLLMGSVVVRDLLHGGGMIP